MILHDGRLLSDVASENLVLVVDMHLSLEGLTSESLSSASFLAVDLLCPYAQDILEGEGIS